MEREPQGTLVVELEGVKKSDKPTRLEGLPDAKIEFSRGAGGVGVAKLVGLTTAGEPVVDTGSDGARSRILARSTVPLSAAAVGREVAVMFIENDPRRPLVVGLLQSPSEPAPDQEVSRVAAEVDGDRLIFTAEREIVIRCGQASITLTRAGKVLIRGAYLLSRSSGVNRIKGGSVQIN